MADRRMTSSLHQVDSALASILTPASISQFLAIEKWTLHSQRSFVETWVHAESPESPLDVIHLPRIAENVDYDKRLVEAVTEVATVFDWSLEELAENVSNVHADLFFVRVAGSGIDGTIPLHQASSTIDAIEQMLKSAAIVTNNAAASGRGGGRLAERVKDFLHEDVRMGHTRRGSFIITVAARLDEHHAQALPVAGSAPPAPPTIPAYPSFEQAVSEIDPGELDFTRRVMTTLSRSLAATGRHLRRGDDFLELDQAQEEGLSAPLIEALEEIGSQPGTSQLDLSFSWAPVLEQSEDVPREVKFQRDAIERIPQVLERLARKSEPGTAVAVGPVVALARETGNGDSSGEVYILADVLGGTKRIGVQLEGLDYEWAIYAHRFRLPLTVSGVLDKVSNRWKFVRDVSLDTTFLRQFQANRVAEATSEVPRESSGPQSETPSAW